MRLFLIYQSFQNRNLEKKILLLLLILIFNRLFCVVMNKQFFERRKILLGSMLFLVVLFAGAGIYTYRMLFYPNFAIDKTVYLYIDNTKNFLSFTKQLEDSAHIRNLKSFVFLSELLDYPREMKTGRYAVIPGTNNWNLLTDLRRAHQAATKLTFNNIRLKTDLAEKISAQLMMDGNHLLRLLEDSATCNAFGFTPETILCLFIPNTYEIYWNISPESLLKRMKREYDAFWTMDRKAKAKSLGLSPEETAILASIVEEETAAADEYPVVAGLYLNRLKRGIPLQADPTVKYAVGNFGLQRILFEHLEVDSPYNTYKYAGLPPGPLRIPTIRGMEAVLDPMQHNYLYMCAKEDFSGRHNFAVTLSEHNRNANRYRAELNRRNIR